MSEQQQLVRFWIRDIWKDLLGDSIEQALQDAQQEDAVNYIADHLWPAFHPDDMMRLDAADPSLVRRGPHAVPDSFAEHLVRRVVVAAEKLAAIKFPSNKYKGGKRLETIIKQEVAGDNDLKRKIEAAFKKRDNDDFTRPMELRELVLRRLSTLAAQELAKLTPVDAETEPKRRLKVLTAIATPGVTPASRAKLLKMLTTGKTSAFPYVLKYIGPNTIPVIQSFPGQPKTTLDGLSEVIVTKFPGADILRECLGRYISRKGVLTHLISPDAPISESLANEFEMLPSFVPRQPGGILMPKELALSENRRDRFRVPEGIACALGIATLTESLLRQMVSAKSWGGSKNARGGELVNRVRDNVNLDPETVANLQVIFDQQSLSLRDATAHAAFFADDEVRLDAVIGGLSQTLAFLIRDLTAAKILDAALAATRWGAGILIDPTHLALIDEQYSPGLNIVDQMKDDDTRKHVFKVIATATPDKRLLGSAGFLLWISGQRDEHTNEPLNDAQQFATLFGSLLTLEELLRALYEANGQRVLRVTKGRDAVRCHLAMLDDKPGELLERSRLEMLFKHYGIEENCIQSFHAVKAVRDLAFHGCWEALPRPWARYTHLAVKLIFTLCSIAHFDTLRKESGQ